MEMTFQVTSAIAALIAACFWIYSATIRIPDFKDLKISGEGSITWLMAKQSKYSAIAAVAAAISALAQVGDIACRIWQLKS